MASSPFAIVEHYVRENIGDEAVDAVKNRYQQHRDKLEALEKTEIKFRAEFKDKIAVKLILDQIDLKSFARSGTGSKPIKKIPRMRVLPAR